MMMSKTYTNFAQAFATSSESIADFFGLPGVAYYIPLYQREYSWDLENIDQLMDDLCQGVDTFIDKSDAILFMGTIILLTDANPVQNINPQDHRALPSRVDNVIDGQQRISTFTLLATLLHHNLTQLKRGLRTAVARESDEINQEVQQVQQEIDSQLATLLEIFTVDLRRGQPKLKPLIIRGSVDCWTLDKSDDLYKSDVANHLALYIRTLEANQPLALPREASPVKRNLRRMSERLESIINSHKGVTDEYPAAWQIFRGIPEEVIWSYAKPHLTPIVNNYLVDPTPLADKLCSVVQLLAFINFMLKRCCFTIIRPTSESWAFDMFQSLNATGTPLTAVETFKPMVSNYIGMNGGYRNSLSERFFTNVDNYLGQSRTANQKNRVTNDFLTTFALIHDGRKLPSQFSVQRRFLEETYDQCASLADREEFMRRMSDLARFRSQVSDAPLDAQSRIAGTEDASDAERDIATLCVAYLKKANHKMADTVLSRFYSILLRSDNQSKQAAQDDFLSVCKAVAAFYTLWRASLANSGLDDAYRKILRGNEGLSWSGNPAKLTVSNLKQRFREALTERQVGDKAPWKTRAVNELRYGNGVDQICRFASLVVAHDTVPDPNTPGLMVKGQQGINPYLKVERWFSPDLSTVEHIAPQISSARGPWDARLYEDEPYHSIGNLTLLPLEINVSASNRGWKEKYLYYKYLTVANPQVDHPAILAEATNEGITLTQENLSKLKSASHKSHLKPITAVGINGSWDRALVESRSERICDLLWDRIFPWLQ
jgi:hypothetical protein